MPSIRFSGRAGEGHLVIVHGFLDEACYSINIEFPQRFIPVIGKGGIKGFNIVFPMLIPPFSFAIAKVHTLWSGNKKSHRHRVYGFDEYDQPKSRTVCVLAAMIIGCD